MARPKAIIDWDAVGENLKTGCDASSIALSIGVDRDTLYVRCKKDNKVDFSAFSQQKRAQGADMLRQKQFEIALNGNVSMLIWLGKQRLGQADKQEIKTPATDKPRNQGESYLDSMSYHARRLFEVYTLEPAGLTFDPDNPEHISELKNTLRRMIESQLRLYPEEKDQLENWEQIFDSRKHF